MTTKNIFYAFLLLVFFTSCKKTPETIDYGKYELGVLISNEGTFNSGNGSISYYNAFNDSISNDIFKTENGRNLGDVVQSVQKIGEYTFIQVNNSNKIEVVDSKTFKEVAAIQNLIQVRYAIGNESNAYASAWGNWGSDGKVYFIDMNTLSVSDSVSAGLGPESLVLYSNKLFVANSGGWGYDHTISVISTDNKTLLSTIEVGANPKSMVLDRNQMLWILCSGSPIYDANWNIVDHYPSKLVQINPDTQSIIKEIELFTDQHPQKLAINPDGNLLYIGAGFGFTGIYTIGIDQLSFSADKLIDRSFYGFDINPDNGSIFAYEALNFTERGKLYRYSENGLELGNYLVGIAPNGGAFKRN